MSYAENLVDRALHRPPVVGAGKPWVPNEDRVPIVSTVHEVYRGGRIDVAQVARVFFNVPNRPSRPEASLFKDVPFDGRDEMTLLELLETMNPLPNRVCMLGIQGDETIAQFAQLARPLYPVSIDEHPEFIFQPDVTPDQAKRNLMSKVGIGCSMAVRIDPLKIQQAYFLVELASYFQSAKFVTSVQSAFPYPNVFFVLEHRIEQPRPSRGPRNLLSAWADCAHKRSKLIERNFVRSDYCVGRDLVKPYHMVTWSQWIAPPPQPDPVPEKNVPSFAPASPAYNPTEGSPCYDPTGANYCPGTPAYDPCAPDYDQASPTGTAYSPTTPGYNPTSPAYEPPPEVESNPQYGSIMNANEDNEQW